VLDAKKAITISLAEVKDASGKSSDAVKRRKKIVDQIRPVPEHQIMEDMKEEDGGKVLLEYLEDHKDRISNKSMIDVKHGKSIFELLFEAMEIAKGKYNYEITDEDITFALMLLDYGIRELFDHKTIDKEGKSIKLGGLVGRHRLGGLTKTATKILEAEEPAGRQKTAIIMHLAVLQDYVDHLIWESADGESAEAARELTAYRTTYDYKAINQTVKNVGLNLIDDGLERIKSAGGF
jgi:hypothetical protein